MGPGATKFVDTLLGRRAWWLGGLRRLILLGSFRLGGWWRFCWGEERYGKPDWFLGGRTGVEMDWTAQQKEEKVVYGGPTRYVPMHCYFISLPSPHDMTVLMPRVYHSVSWISVVHPISVHAVDSCI